MSPAWFAVANVLRVPRPAGSGRPNKGRKLISLWVSEAGLEAVDKLAEQHGCTRSDVIRLALKHGLDQAARELKRIT
jgi:hypothetical protein